MDAECGNAWSRIVGRDGLVSWTQLDGCRGQRWVSVVGKCGHRPWKHVVLCCGQGWVQNVDRRGAVPWRCVGLRCGCWWANIVEERGPMLWRYVEACCGRAWVSYCGVPLWTRLDEECGSPLPERVEIHLQSWVSTSWVQDCIDVARQSLFHVGVVLAPLRGESWACVMEVCGRPSWACVVEERGPGIVAMRGGVLWAPRTQCVVVPRVDAHVVHVAACIIRLHVTRPRGVQVGASRCVDSIAPKRSHRKERKQEKKEKIFCKTFWKSNTYHHICISSVRQTERAN